MEAAKKPTEIPLYKQSTDPMVGGATKINLCKLCKNTPFKTDYDFKLHLTQIHYWDELILRVQTQGSHECKNCGFRPQDQAGSEAEKLEEIVMHYGMDEDVAIESYQRSGHQLNSILKTFHIQGSTRDLPGDALVL